MESLSTAEWKIIREMLVRDSGSNGAFLHQLALARVEQRRLSGVGTFVDLALPMEAAPVDNVDTEITSFYSTVLCAPCDTVGFTLFIRKGHIKLLEGYTFGEARWPTEPMENWLIFDKTAAVSAKNP